MRKFILTLACILVVAGPASAQRVQVGLRGGINISDYRFAPTTIGDIHFAPGPARAGYTFGLALRLNLTKHFHLQSELNYASVNYEVRASGSLWNNIKLHTERLEIPIQLGLQFGVVRLFGGVLFRVTDSGRSSAPKWLKVGFNNDDIGLTGGLGLNIRKFFIDFRISGYPRSHIWQTFTSGGSTQRVAVDHDIVYGGSLGFFF